MPFARAFVALALVGAVAVAFWSWLGRTVDLPPVTNGRLQCLSYTPTHPGGSPLDGPDYTLPDGLVEADLAALLEVTGCLRTYSSFGVQGQVLPVAAQLGMQVLLGIWIGADEERNAIEIDAALALAARYPQAVREIVVGNEVLLRREMSGERLARVIRSVKARTDLPVTYADIFEFWRRNPVVADAVDVVTIHVLPYWDDPTPVSIDEVQAHVAGIIATARQTFPGKKLQIGEIGWPSAGRTRGRAAPGLVNKARFVREFANQSERLGLPYNIIEAIDQPWKRRSEGTVGWFRRIVDHKLAVKFPLQGPVSEWPDWPVAAAASIAAGLVAVTVVAAWRRRLGFARWLAVAAAGTATGASLYPLFFQLQALAIGLPGLAFSAVVLLVAMVGGVLLLVLLAAPELAERPAPLTAVLGWLRRPCVRKADLLGLAHWLVILTAAILALLLAVDGRHRDFLTLAFWPAAAAFALLAWRSRKPDHTHRPEEAWMAGLLLLSGPLSIDDPSNREAIAWAACCVALAFPWLPSIPAELRHLLRRLPA